MTVHPQPRFLPAGDRALTVELGDEISPEINTRVRGLALALERRQLAGVVELVPTYRSLLVYYDPMQLEMPALRDVILSLSDTDTVVPPTSRVLHIPTHYGGEHGPDMDFVARHTGLTPREVADIHAGTDYLVYMMGFNTSFPYLGGLSGRIAVPRLDTPRTVVPAGSVAIALRQTGIYPVESPGGWRLIGRSPVRLFDASKIPPVALEAGDYLRFIQIDEERYREIDGQVQANRYDFVFTERTP